MQWPEERPLSLTFGRTSDLAEVGMLMAGVREMSSMGVMKERGAGAGA